MNTTLTEIRLTKGSSYFGSGGYSAGWNVLEGEVEATPIAGSEHDNGFIETVDYLIRPKTDTAVIKAHCFDCISQNGRRALGPEGVIVLVKNPDQTTPPKTCPHCGYAIGGSAL